ncbi:MAG: hypothetical protein A2Y40_01055 [Candidatus Margulisbacteria bacterium GWF2_35_9]|nr:MAG: hypothetical protein A2Y40_01055 [Candidatus Margulisbacteria bacterium GWF2_35_9]
MKCQKVNFVLTDKESIGIINLCTVLNIPIFIGNPRQGKAKGFIDQFDTDIIFSINYIYIVEQDIIKYPKSYAINFHGSLLPKYRGRSPHVWAIINNEKTTGISAHLITEECDAGCLIYQEIIPIPEDITGAEILTEFKKQYPIVISIVIDMIQKDTINPVKQDNSKATWFGKRTPADGIINWNWQKEQLRNWIRAQTKLYPGAFTFYNHQKITIYRIEYCDYGFNQFDENGIILDIRDGVIVKTPNGAIRILDYDSDIPIEFKKGGMFHG